MCRRDDFTSTTTHRALPKLFPSVLPSQTRFIVLPCPGFLNTHVIHGSGTYRKIEALAAQPRTAWALEEYCSFGQHSENEHCFWLVMWTAENCTVLLAGVLGLGSVAVFQVKHMEIPQKPHYIELCSSRDHTRPPKLSFALVKVLTMNAQNTSFSLSGSYSLTQRVKRYCNWSYWCCAYCESDPVIDARCSAVVGSDRADRSSDVCYVGDTR